MQEKKEAALKEAAEAKAKAIEMERTKAARLAMFVDETMLKLTNTIMAEMYNEQLWVVAAEYSDIWDKLADEAHATLLQSLAQDAEGAPQRIFGGGFAGGAGDYGGGYDQGGGYGGGSSGGGQGFGGGSGGGQRGGSAGGGAPASDPMDLDDDIPSRPASAPASSNASVHGASNGKGA